MHKTILIVEDDKLIREGLARTLKEKGFTTLLAVNGKEGLQVAQENDIDLVVTDVIMPEVDGLTMLAELRKTTKGQTIPAIILTNDEQTDSLNKAMQAGVTAYLSKATLDADTMAEQITSMLG